MQNAAALLLAVRLSKKKSGTPMSAAAPKTYKLPFGKSKQHFGF